MVIEMNFSDIISGSRPSDVFKDHIERNTGIDRADFGFDFSDYFPGVNGASHMAIWKWKSGDGIDDNLFDVIIVNFLKDAGYIE